MKRKLCVYCGGSGVDPETMGPCPDCNGLRTVPVEEEKPKQLSLLGKVRKWWNAKWHT